MRTPGKQLVRRWVSWSLPTKIGIIVSLIGTMTGLLSVALYFWDLKPFLERWFSPPPAVRNIAVRIDNPAKTDVSLSYRDELVLWLPTALSDSAPRIGGMYEVVASDAGLVKDGVVPIRAAGETRIVVKVMDQDRLYRFLRRCDTTLTLMFHRPDGSIFFSDNIPFTDEALRKFYARADMAGMR
jgi:hypothetical protein